MQGVFNTNGGTLNTGTDVPDFYGFAYNDTLFMYDYSVETDIGFPTPGMFGNANLIVTKVEITGTNSASFSSDFAGTKTVSPLNFFRIGVAFQADLQGIGDRHVEDNV